MQPLDSIAFQLGPIAVHWYGMIMASAILTGLWLTVREAKRQGFNPNIFTDLVMWAAPIAIIGARTYYVLFDWDNYRAHPEDIVAVWEGGLAIHR